MAALLLIDDDPLLRAALQLDLVGRGHLVRTAAAALPALQDLATSPPDLVILDLELPDLDGGRVLHLIRSLHPDLPVVIASARNEDAEIAQLLREGADDYLVKPFSHDQLDARVTAVLRRSRREQVTVWSVGDLVVDAGRREALLAGRLLPLTRREFDLLAYLAARPDQVVSHRELLTEVWRNTHGQRQLIDVQLSMLRRKLDETAESPRYLHRVRGVGVRLSAPTHG